MSLLDFFKKILNRTHCIPYILHILTDFLKYYFPIRCFCILIFKTKRKALEIKEKRGQSLFSITATYDVMNDDDWICCSCDTESLRCGISDWVCSVPASARTVAVTPSPDDQSVRRGLLHASRKDWQDDGDPP